MANSSWSQLIIDVHLVETDEVVFIRGSDLPQPLGTELVPVDFGLDAFIQIVTEHCQDTKPSPESLVLIDPYSRVVQDTHRFRQVLERLVKTPSNPTIWRLRCKDTTSSGSSSLSRQTVVTTHTNLAQASISINSIPANIRSDDEPTSTTFYSAPAALHPYEPSPTLRANDGFAITHVKHDTPAEHLPDGAAIELSSDDLLNLDSNNNSSPAHLAIDSATMSTDGDKAISGIHTTSPVLSPSAQILSGDIAPPCMSHQSPLGLETKSSSMCSDSARHCTPADASGVLDLDGGFLTLLNPQRQDEPLSTSDAIESSPGQFEPNIVDRAASLSLDNSLPDLSSRHSEQVNPLPSSSDTAASCHTRKKAKVEDTNNPGSIKSVPTVVQNHAKVCPESSRVSSLDPINTMQTDTHKLPSGHQESSHLAEAQVRKELNNFIVGGSPSDAISIGDEDEDGESADEEMGLPAAMQTGVAQFDQQLAEAAVVNNFEQMDKARFDNVCRLFLQPDGSSGKREFVKVPWLKRLPLNYQAHGAYFLLETDNSIGGSVLADEMGLGKTMTIITALATISMIIQTQRHHRQCTVSLCAHQEGASSPLASPVCPKAINAPPVMSMRFRNLPTLIAVPARSIDNWVAEFEVSVRKTKLDYIRVHGDRGGRPDLYQYMVGADGMAKGPAQRDLYRTVILTSKESMKGRIVDYRPGPQHQGQTEPRMLRFARVIVDESHEFKGEATNFVKGLLQFAGDGAATWFMTGTPLGKGPVSVAYCFKCWDRKNKTGIAKKIKELDLTFRSACRKMVENSRPPGKPTGKVGAGKEKTSAAAKLNDAEEKMESVATTLGEYLRPHMLQRSSNSKFLGQTLMDVPPMTCQDKIVALPSEWVEKYRHYWHKLQAERFQQNTSLKRQANEGDEKPGRAVGFTHLRMSMIYSGFPALLNHPDQTWANLELEDSRQPESCLFTMAELKTLLQTSPKLRSLITDLRDLGLPTESISHGNSIEKVVLFTKYPVEAYIIHQILTKLKGFGSCLLLTATPLAARLHLINDVFQGIANPSQADVLVTTYGIGGTCHNMIKARTVILFGPDFSETVEKQAQHRIKRVGQTLPTRSIRYLADMTIDRLLVLRQQVRSKFDDRVLGLAVDGLAPVGPDVSTNFLANMGQRNEEDDSRPPKPT